MTTSESPARPPLAYLVFAAVCIACGVALHADGLRGGLLSDDWDHYAMSAGIYPTPRSVFNHFDFVGASASEHRALQQLGRLPWWIAPNLHMALMRPLASVLGALDYGLLDSGHHPWRMHLHSLAWWVVLLVGVAWLLRSLLPLPAAALGFLLYVFDDAHIVPVTWAANRSELIANACCVWALYFQLRASSERRPALYAATWALIASALLAGEHAVPMLAYALVFGSSRTFAGGGRFKHWVMPLAIAIVGYFAVRHWLGFGAAGLGMYDDPLASPWAFLHVCRERLPILFGDAMFGVPAEWYPGGPPFTGYLYGLPIIPDGVTWVVLQRALGWLAIATIIVSVVALSLRSSRERAACALACLLAAAALSLVPMCASVPMSRLTMPAVLGVHAAWGYGLYALGLRAWRTRHAPALLTAAALSCTIFWIHILCSGLRTQQEIARYVMISHVEEAWVTEPELDLGGRDVMLLSGGWATHWVVPFVRHLHAEPAPRSFQPLSAAHFSPHVLERIADDVLDIHIPWPRFASFVGSVYRATNQPFRAGQVIVSPHFEVRIVAVEHGEPTWLRLHFPRSIDSEQYVFLRSAPEGLTRIAMPDVGQRIEFPLTAFPVPR